MAQIRPTFVNLLAGMLLGAILTGCGMQFHDTAPLGPATGAADQVLLVARETAFRREGVVGDQRLIKWCRQPVFDVNAATQRSDDMATGVARRAAELAGFQFANVEGDGEAPASFSISVGVEPDLSRLVTPSGGDPRKQSGLTRSQRRLISRARCAFRLNVDRKSCIRSALVIVPAGLDRASTDHCIAEEIFQAMGLVGDARFSFQSLFSEGVQLSAPSVTDMAALKLLYRPELRPGMTQQEAVAVMSSIVETVAEE